MYEYRCDERLKAKAEGSTRLSSHGKFLNENCLFIMNLKKFMFYYYARIRGMYLEKKKE